MAAFHYQNGVTFERVGNGNVHVRIPVGYGDDENDPFAVDLDISPSSWASIVASVSAGGEVNNYQAAVNLHAGRAGGET